MIYKVEITPKTNNLDYPVNASVSLPARFSNLSEAKQLKGNLFLAIGHKFSISIKETEF